LTSGTYICPRVSQIGLRRAWLRRISRCAVQRRVFALTTTVKTAEAKSLVEAAEVYDLNEIKIARQAGGSR